MKKNLVFKLGLFCAALVLVATCFVTNAWAKYTKSVTATDSARVAKFDFEINELLGAEWSSNTAITVFDTTFKNIMVDGDSDLGSDSKKLIAPGSYGQFTIEMNNSSEVTLQFKLEAEDVETHDIPLKWSYVYDGNTYTSNSLKDCLADATSRHGNWVTTVGGSVNKLTISWEWPWEADDALDTALGLAGNDTYTVNIKCTATQVAPDAA